jgi:hypothetical protein
MILHDIPRAEAPDPFGAIDARERFFIHRSAGGFSRMVGSLDELHAIKDAFPMGYTSLWLMERLHLRLPDASRSWAPVEKPAPKEGEAVGRCYVFHDIRTREHWHPVTGGWVLGYQNPDEAVAALELAWRTEQLGGIVALLIEDVFWH